MQGCVLEAAGVPSNIANALLDLKTNKDQTVIDIKKVRAQLIHTCTDSIAIAGPANFTNELKRL